MTLHDVEGLNTRRRGVAHFATVHSMSESSTIELLNESLGNVVLVKLKGGRDLRGVLKSFDEHLNIVLDNAQELKEGQENRELGTIIVRGDSVIIISPAPG